MTNQTAKSILILDDDSYFRGLVANLLRPRGYKVVEASNPEEANRILAAKETALAIVDYRMPRMDGMAWISQLREMGGNIPVVFCSGQRADPSLFNRLRNVLGVSLILQKPIIPATFIQQIEDLLPNYQRVNPDDEVAWNAMDGKKRQGLKNQATTFSQSKDELAHLLAEATNEYIKELETVWNDLVRYINDFNNSTENMHALSEAVRIAHTIRGTAGSLGLTQIGYCAGKLEDLMRNLSPDKTTDQEVIWSEIIRKLADGTSAVQDALTTIRGENAGAEAYEAIANLLLVSSAPEVHVLSQTQEMLAMANVISANDTNELNKRIDAAIIDLNISDKEAWQWAREIRRKVRNDRLPLGYILPQGESMASSERIMCGASIVIEHPVTGTALQDCLLQLLTVGFQNQPRILVVDDDEVLTKFVSGLLQTERMFTQSVNNPMAVPEMVTAFQPDLILMDVIMPVLTGYEVCRAIRENPDWIDIPIIFLTSQTSTQAKAAAFAAGATDFLTKPILPEELITRVNTHIQTSNRRQKTHGIDPATGFLSMESFLAQLKILMQTQAPNSVSVAALTIDNFDELSLFQGVQHAKSVSAQLVKLLSLGLRAEDLICRYGDQGCLIALAGLSAQTVNEALSSARDGFSQVPFQGNAGTFKSSFSAGVAESTSSDTCETLLQSAYKNMLQARQNQVGVV